jgi:hypothetical protein
MEREVVGRIGAAIAGVIVMCSLAAAARLFLWGLTSSSDALLVLLALCASALLGTGGALALGCWRLSHAASVRGVAPPSRGTMADVEHLNETRWPSAS